MNLNARLFGQRLLGFLVLSGVLVVGSALGQGEVRASAKQRRSMAPLVESVALCLELHIPSVSASKVEYRVRKALAYLVIYWTFRWIRKFVFSEISNSFVKKTND